LFVNNSLSRAQMIAYLNNMSDIERIINRISGNIANPNELIALKHALEVVPKIKETLENTSDNITVKWLHEGLRPHLEVVELIGKSIIEQPSTGVGEGGVIRPDFSEEMDSLRSISKNAKQYLANLERAEQEKNRH